MGLHIYHGKNPGLKSWLSISIGPRWFNLRWKSKRATANA